MRAPTSLTETASRSLLDVPPTLSLRSVAAFVEVAERASFRKAAQRLYLDASYASKLVRQLEAELGVQLFERSTRHVHLTPEGEEVLVVAKRLLRESRKLVRVAQQKASLTSRLSA